MMTTSISILSISNSATSWSSTCSILVRPATTTFSLNCIINKTRSLGPLRGPTSSWRPDQEWRRNCTFSKVDHHHCQSRDGLHLHRQHHFIINKLIIIVMTNIFMGILPPFAGVQSQTGVKPCLWSHLAEYRVDFVWILDCFGWVGSGLGLVILLWFDIRLS